MKYGLLTLLFILFLACTNDLKQVREITYKSTDPDEKTTNLFLTYTDSGQAQIRLFAPLAESFGQVKKKIKFSKGLKLEFYNKSGTLSSLLTAKYGEVDDEKGTMEVRDSVRIYSPLKKETMETESLFWNKKDSTIFTNKLVVIRSEKGTIFGEGIRMKQDFSSYVFLRPKGKIKLD